MYHAAPHVYECGKKKIATPICLCIYNNLEHIICSIYCVLCIHVYIAMVYYEKSWSLFQLLKYEA